jgi:hypothetical protein
LPIGGSEELWKDRSLEGIALSMLRREVDCGSDGALPSKPIGGSEEFTIPNLPGGTPS